MVICEKDLMAAMKEDYKGTGYTVARRVDISKEEDVLVIEGTSYLAEISWENVPSKILALIVEHLKQLPIPGEAIRAKKGDSQTAIFGMLNRMPLPTEDESPVVGIHRTSLAYGVMEVWQKFGNNGCVFVPDGMSDMLLDYGRCVVWVDGGLHLKGEASQVFVRCFVPSEINKQEMEEAINYLSGKAWS